MICPGFAGFQVCLSYNVGTLKGVNFSKWCIFVRCHFSNINTAVSTSNYGVKGSETCKNDQKRATWTKPQKAQLQAKYGL